MKKMIFTLLFAVFTLSFMIFPASADNVNTLDSTGILSEEHIMTLEQKAERIEEEFGYYTMICFAENINGYDSIRDYGSMLYETYTDSASAVIFVHDFNQNLCDSFIAEPYEDYVFDSEKRELIFNAYNNAETYYQGAVAFYDTVYDILKDSEVIADVTENTTDSIRPFVVDNADILTDEEERYFIKKCAEFTETYSAEIVILTVNSLEGKNYFDFTEDYYRDNGYGFGEEKDGLICMVCLEDGGERYLCISTFGAVYDIIPEVTREDIYNDVVAELKDGDYKAAFDTYISLSEDALKGISPVISLLFCVVICAVIGIVITLIIASGNKSVKKNRDATVYARKESLNITYHNDVFRNSRVVATPKIQPKNNSTGSSSSRSSSSGRSGSTGGTF